MSISISKAEAFAIADAIGGIKATEKELGNAYHQSIGRAVNYANKRVTREIASRLDIPLKLLRKRLFVFKQDSHKGSYKIWAGLNDLPLDGLGRPKQVGIDVLVKGITAGNAYITKAGRVRLRGTAELAVLVIDEQAEDLLQKLLPYYFYDYFEKEFTQLVKFKFGGT
ncbi:hypothetical protein [Caedibacter taeniospiralis]|uniref:hypothetical protein n=1 Tax=Caedibacter taeniospiralis TaxID=28907 RepID=UPI000C27BE43|nr:hypothetical protein [Caedibacter taeniospiralis]